MTTVSHNLPKASLNLVSACPGESNHNAVNIWVFVKINKIFVLTNNLQERGTITLLIAVAFLFCVWQLTLTNTANGSYFITNFASEIPLIH